MTCPPCRGEGELLTFTSRDYSWWSDTDDETILSPSVNRKDVRVLITRVRKKGGSAVIDRFTRSEVMRTTSVFNERIEQLLRLAESHRLELEQKIRSRSDLIVFQDVRREFIPLLYINLFAGRTYGQCFVAGTLQEQDIHLRIPLSPTKCGAWMSLGIVVLLLISGSAPVFWAPFLLLFFLLVGMSVHSVMQVHGLSAPERWIVLDDSNGRAWQFAYIYAQSISRHGVARITDPWFTSLLEPPVSDSVQGRNSFLFTVEDLQEFNLDSTQKSSDEIRQSTESKFIGTDVGGEQIQGATKSVARVVPTESARKRKEVLVVGWRAQQKFADDVQKLVVGATHIVLMMSGETAVREMLSQLTAKLPPESMQKLRITFVRDSEELRPVDWNSDFSREIDPNLRVEFFELPLSRMCEEARTGSVTPDSQAEYTKLLAFEGVDTTEKDSVAIEELEYLLYHETHSDTIIDIESPRSISDDGKEPPRGFDPNTYLRMDVDEIQELRNEETND